MNIKKPNFLLFLAAFLFKGERSRTLERNVEMAVCEKEKERVAREVSLFAKIIAVLVLQ